MHICETLGKTVDEVLDTMNPDEFSLWIAWFKYKSEQEQKSNKQTPRRTGNIRRVR